MSLRLIAALLSLIVCAFSLSSPLAVQAQSKTRNAIITLAPISGAAKVELVAQTLDVDVLEAGDNTILNGQLVFKLHNTDRLARAEMLVGFPSWGGGAQELDEKSFTQFVIALNGQILQPAWQIQPLKLGNETRNVRWLTWPMSLVEDERATIQVTFKQELGGDVLPTIAFAQAPAILWKGFVGSARYSVHFPVLTSPEQLRVLVPAGSTFDGRNLTWLFSDFNPEAPILLQLIKPRLWRELTQARLTLAQTADAKAALALGAQFTQLAHASQSASDFAQALAAYQRASEIDAASPAAPLALAKLYEARLRGEFDAVGDEGALRAAVLEQWQRVLKLQPNNTEARDAVALHTFTLAQLARRSNHFGGALPLLETARATGSNQPTRAQIDNEERADRAGLTLQQIDAGQWTDALQTIESGALGSEAAVEKESFMPLFSSVQARIFFDGTNQSCDWRVTPFIKSSARHQKLLNELLMRLADVAPKPQLPPNTAMGALEPDLPNASEYMLRLTAAARPLRADDLANIAPELAIVRDTLTPAELRLSHSENIFTSDDEFIARFSLAEMQRVAQSRLADIEHALSGLRAPAADETQEITRRLRVRMLETYKTGWQNLLNTSAARIEWSVSGQVWDLRPGESQTLQAQHTTYQTWTIIGAGWGVLLALVLGAWVIRKLRR